MAGAIFLIVLDSAYEIATVLPAGTARIVSMIRSGSARTTIVPTGSSRATVVKSGSARSQS